MQIRQKKIQLPGSIYQHTSSQEYTDVTVGKKVKQN